MSELLDNLINLVKLRISTDSSDDEIMKALELSLSAFNMIPSVSYFTFEDDENINQLSDILATYAAYILATSKAARVIGNDKESNDMFMLARELWNNWYTQVNTLKQSESFYKDFVEE